MDSQCATDSHDPLRITVAAHTLATLRAFALRIHVMPGLHSPHIYAGTRFDRLSERRNDADWLAQQLRAGNAQLLPLWQGRHLLSGGTESPRMVLLEHARCAGVTLEQLVLLGEFRGQLCFAVELSGETPPPLGDDAAFHELRFLAGLLDRDEAGLLGYARALLLWRERHRYCGRCGAPTLSRSGGHVLECTNASCKLSHFPRLDPCIIVLVSDGERALLGRQAAWPPQRYSTIAGFMEWGESVEEAVAREVREETGVIIDEVRYHSSQPWPFPSSLMLGFMARAATTDIVCSDSELEDARWFTREDIANGAIRSPLSHSISFHLIESWYNQGATRSLREVLGAATHTW